MNLVGISDSGQSGPTFVPSMDRVITLQGRRTRMPINETATGDDSVAITGSATGGERTVGILGQGDSDGVKGVGQKWHGVEGISHSTIGGFGVYGANLAGGLASRDGVHVSPQARRGNRLAGTEGTAIG